MTLDLLIATSNPGKAAELRGLLAREPYDIWTLAELGRTIEVPETGDTFKANAEMKASGYARLYGMLALADDSGLEVSVLGGRPGVLSARYGGDELDFPGKISKLLNEVAARHSPDRSARFVCAMAIAGPDGTILFSTEGICEGCLAREPRGIGGFGYDPLFIPDGFEKTFGELDASVKAHISHRARAIAEIIPFLRHFVGI